MNKAEKIKEIVDARHEMENAVRASDMANDKGPDGVPFLRKIMKETGVTLFNLRRLSVADGFHDEADAFLKYLSSITYTAKL